MQFLLWGLRKFFIVIKKVSAGNEYADMVTPVTGKNI
jgi:hypothetical protein